MDTLFNTATEVDFVKSNVWQLAELNETTAALRDAGVEFELALFRSAGTADPDNNEMDEASFTRENGELIDETSDVSQAAYVGLILHLKAGCGAAPSNIPTGWSFDVDQTERGGIYNRPAFFYPLR